MSCLEKGTPLASPSEVYVELAYSAYARLILLTLLIHVDAALLFCENLGMGQVRLEGWRAYQEYLGSEHYHWRLAEKQRKETGLL